jgi:hypothetical protein
MARYRSDEKPGKDLFLLIFGLACLIGSIVLVVWNLRWVSSAMAGPVKMSIAELAKIEDPARLDNPWVTISLAGAENTGLGLTSTKGGSTTNKSKYLVLPVEGRWLIVEVPANHSGNEATGYLDRWGTPLRKEAITKIEAAKSQYKGKFLPYQFDGEYGYRSQCWAMLGIAGFGLVCGIFLTGTWLVAVTRKPERRRKVEDDI